MTIDANIKQIAARIADLRDILELTIEEMAQVTGVTPAEYAEYESGLKDFSFTFLYKAAKRLGVDITDLLTGDMPKLSVYSVVRKGDGLAIDRRAGFAYQSMAYIFKDRRAEPFVVTAPYCAAEQDKPIALSNHNSQEMDFILKGSLKIIVDGNTEILNEGDAIYYDANKPHGMIAISEGGCDFLAVVIE